MKKMFSLNKFFDKHGMSLVEVMIAVLMASIFMSVYVLVVEVIGKFTPSVSNTVNGSQGIIIDHHKLQITIDKYARVLEQPGITKAQINTIISSQKLGLPNGCSLNPSNDWDVPIPINAIENTNWQPSSAGYAICLFSSGISESNLPELINNVGKPGIYILMGLPQTISINSLPIRRLFCRPRPFC